MNKYNSPEVEVLEISVEQGFATSNGNGTESGGTIDPDPMEPA